MKAFFFAAIFSLLKVKVKVKRERGGEKKYKYIFNENKTIHTLFAGMYLLSEQKFHQHTEVFLPCNVRDAETI